jgi:hypothetical protein
MGLMLKKPEGSAGSAWPAILVGLFVAFGGVLYGSVLMNLILKQFLTLSQI